MQLNGSHIKVTQPCIPKNSQFEVWITFFIENVPYFVNDAQIKGWILGVGNIYQSDSKYHVDIYYSLKL